MHGCGDQSEPCKGRATRSYAPQSSTDSRGHPRVCAMSHLPPTQNVPASTTPFSSTTTPSPRTAPRPTTAPTPNTAPSPSTEPAPTTAPSPTEEPPPTSAPSMTAERSPSDTGATSPRTVAPYQTLADGVAVTAPSTDAVGAIKAASGGGAPLFSGSTLRCRDTAGGRQIPKGAQGRYMRQERRVRRKLSETPFAANASASGAAAAESNAVYVPQVPYQPHRTAHLTTGKVHLIFPQETCYLLFVSSTGGPQKRCRKNVRRSV